jgi:hypothetical protein
LAKGLSRENLIALAKHGAAARIKELHAEIAAITAQFPGLGGRGGVKRGRKAVVRRRRKMSAEARKRISEAQKARWAKKKSAGGSKKK